MSNRYWGPGMVGSSRSRVPAFREFMQTAQCSMFVSGLCLRRVEEAMDTWHQSCECLIVFISEDYWHFYFLGGSPLNLYCVHFVQGQEESNSFFQNQGEGELACLDHMPSVLIFFQLCPWKLLNDHGSSLSFAGLGDSSSGWHSWGCTKRQARSTWGASGCW